MKFATLHRWPRSTRAAIELQRHLAGRVQLTPLREELRLIAGADVATVGASGVEEGAPARIVAGVVVWDAKAGVVVERVVVCRRTRFPYVPGLLSFRESPAVLAAFRRLRTRPQAVLCDGQGLAHPRRFGLACHVGLWLGLATVGCAKSRLCGDYVPPGPKRGSVSPLMLDGTQLGVVLRTRDNVRPVFVSPGHLCDVEGAWRLVLATCGPYRLPEPIRAAHQLVTQEAARLRAGCGVGTAGAGELSGQTGPGI
jgi:deoxyribonuclease V